MRAEKAIDAQTSHILALTAELQAAQAMIGKVNLVNERDVIHVMLNVMLII